MKQVEFQTAFSKVVIRSSGANVIFWMNLKSFFYRCIDLYRISSIETTIFISIIDKCCPGQLLNPALNGK